MRVINQTPLFIAFLLLLLAACNGGEKSSQTTTLNLNSCILGRWHDSKLPLKLKISDSILSDMAQSHSGYTEVANPINNMAIQWQNAVGSSKPLFELPLGRTHEVSNAASLNDYYRDSAIGIYKSNSWFADSSTNALAVTYYHGVITSNARLGQYLEYTHADIILNYRYFGDRFSYSTANNYFYHVPTVVLHEIGHLIGFCHEEDQYSVMAPRYSGVLNSLTSYDRNFSAYVYETGSSSGVNKAIATKKSSAPSQLKDGETISGIIELKEDGKCVHSLNGHVIYEHQVDISSKNFPMKEKSL